MSRIPNYIYIIAILLIGGVLRFYNLNWDQGFYFHPDERNIANAVSKIHFFTHLNPEFFAYGGLTIYLIRFFADLLYWITNDNSWVTNWGAINLIGRYLSAFFSTLTIIPIYLLAKKLFNSLAGLIAAAIFALTVSSIQSAHFATVENLMVLLLTLITYLSIVFYQHQTIKQLLIIGALCGMATATKSTALSFSLIPLTVTIFLILQKHLIFKKFLIYLTIFFILNSLFLILFSPYTFLSWDKFLESMSYEQGVATGSLSVVYTYQFIGTTPYLYQLQNLLWQMGPIAVLSVIGFALLLVHSIYHRRYSFIIFLVFPLIYFGYIGSWHTKFIRYMLPTIPFLVISAAALLALIIRHHKVLGLLLTTFSLLITICYSLAFFSIYSRPQTRILASEWIFANIPTESKILREHWDDGLPVLLPNNKTYYLEELTIYEPDNENKINYYADKLSTGDYIVINSRRLYGTLLHLTDKYPITSRYYQQLFQGQLGYQKVAEFSSYPQLLGLTINDDRSEESFQVYDHPKVMIFQNQQRLGYLQLIDRLK